MKTVVYQGYEFRVPADWPVYRLDEHPRTCVRYDVHAVYLGSPGQDMRCPAGLVGRTQTISFVPGQQAAAGPGAGPGARGSARQPGAGSAVPQRLPVARSAANGVIRSAVKSNAVQHELSVALGAAALGATVLGTYGTDPAVVSQVLGSLRQASAAVPQSAPQAKQARQARQSDQSDQARQARQAAHAATPSESWRGVPAHWPAQAVRAQPPVGGQRGTAAVHPVGGFDACTAPTGHAMHLWRSDYSAVGIYLGGVNAACAHGNLNPTWVRAIASWGWGMLPTYVGPQAPCWRGTGVLIDPHKAAAQGKAAATDAVHQARALGIGPGAPIYYDLEGYKGDGACTGAVLAFLNAWDRQLAGARYVTAVYSSQNSGISDIQGAARTSGFSPPKAVWIALWDNSPSLALGSLLWPMPDRSKQYSGNVNATVRGITINIDKDIVDGPLAR